MKKFIILLWIFFVAITTFASDKKHASLESDQLRASIFLLQSPQGKGTGFLADIFGKKYLVTNNHVALEMPDITIFDINGEKYPYKIILCHKERDLALIEIDTNAPALRIESHIETLPVHTPVSAIGDSLGASIVVSVNGKLLGVGPATIEVDSAFVPGNSGGPIINLNENTVIGVATYCTIIENKNVLTGSRFSSNQGVIVRRFGTRIDNLKLDDFQNLTLDQIREDQKKFIPADILFKEIRSHLMNNELGKCHDPVSKYKFPLNDYGTWNSAYLKKIYDSQNELVVALRKYLKPFSLGYDSSPKLKDLLKKIWEEQYDNQRIEKVAQKMKTCLLCNGKGVFITERYKYRAEDNSQRLHIGFGPCYTCNQKGVITIVNAQENIILSKEFCDCLANEISIEEQNIFGFNLGAPFLEQLKQRTFYSKDKLIFSSNYAFGKIFIYTGNEDIEEAERTMFITVGDTLLDIRVIVNMPSEEKRIDFEKYIVNKANSLKQARFFLYHISKFPYYISPPELFKWDGKEYYLKYSYNKASHAGKMPVFTKEFDGYIYDPLGEYWIQRPYGSFEGSISPYINCYSDFKYWNQAEGERIMLSARHNVFNEIWEITRIKKSSFSF